MYRVIAVANQKGGVGKTTTAINLSASLASVLGYKTLVIDVDPQANTTSGLGFNIADIKGGVYEIMVNAMPLEQVIRPTSIENLDIIPSDIDLVGAELDLVNMDNREYMMSEMVDKLSNRYDYIIIDCAPSLGLVTVNALTCADSVIIPVQCEYFALQGLGKLLNTIKIIQSGLNPSLYIEGVLLTMYSSNLRLANQVVKDARSCLGNTVFNTIIPRSVKISEATGFGKPGLLYDEVGKGTIAYLNLAKEIADRYKDKE
jgi:chromosome partitioning protein